MGWRGRVVFGGSASDPAVQLVPASGVIVGAL